MLRLGVFKLVLRNEAFILQITEKGSWVDINNKTIFYPIFNLLPKLSITVKILLSICLKKNRKLYLFKLEQGNCHCFRRVDMTLSLNRR